MAEYQGFLGRNTAISVVFTIVATTVVALRFHARRMLRLPLLIDDWLALVSLIFFLSSLAIAIYFATVGDGYDLETLPPDVLVRYLKVEYAGPLVTIPCITAAKLSVLYLYRRIFSIDHRFRIVLYIMMWICVAWGIAAEVSLILHCVPISKTWNLTEPGTCISFPKWIVGMESSNVLIDFVMIAMPINIIRGLQLPLRLKLAVSGIFFIGVIVGVVGIIRIAVLYNPTTIDLSMLGILVNFQLLLAVLCANLPVLRPFLPKNQIIISMLQGFAASARSLIGNVTKRSRHTAGASIISSDNMSSKSDVYQQFVQSSETATTVHAQGKNVSQPEDGILVHREIELKTL